MANYRALSLVHNTWIASPESMVVVYALARCCSVLACQAGLVSGGGCEVTLVYLRPFHPMQMTRRMPEITIPGY